MKLLKISTAGSVDDGKSTLIGRLLYDTNTLPEDKRQSLIDYSQKKNLDYIDFSVATDGLTAEREQGITIDVAHIYFNTPKRSFIIADTPGHIEYTRNMITGASNTELSIVLVDARKGVVEQTKRHLFITQLLRIPQVVVAINKMDLVDYSESIYTSIVHELQTLIDRSHHTSNVTFLPMSALQGDNVISHSSKTPWYRGNSLLHLLESVVVEPEQEAFRLPIQKVIRPLNDKFHDFRGYAGKILGSHLTVGDQVTVLPSLQTSKVQAIHFYNQEYTHAEVNSSVTVELEDDIDVSRGNTLVFPTQVPYATKQIKAYLSWLNTEPLTPTKLYTLQHRTNKLSVKVKQINYRVHTDFTKEAYDHSGVRMNDIVELELMTNKALYVDAFSESRAYGHFILIDNQSHNTVAVGFINR